MFKLRFKLIAFADILYKCLTVIEIVVKSFVVLFGGFIFNI